MDLLKIVILALSPIVFWLAFNFVFFAFIVSSVAKRRGWDEDEWFSKGVVFGPLSIWMAWEKKRSETRGGRSLSEETGRQIVGVIARERGRFMGLSVILRTLLKVWLSATVLWLVLASFLWWPTADYMWDSFVPWLVFPPVYLLLIVLLGYWAFRGVLEKGK